MSRPGQITMADLIKQMETLKVKKPDPRSTELAACGLLGIQEKDLPRHLQNYLKTVPRFKP